MPKSADQSLIERAAHLKAELYRARGEKRRKLEIELGWLWFDRGELARALRTFGAESEGKYELQRAEVEAWCGAEDVALHRISSAASDLDAGALVRSRVASARGDWQEAERWAAEARDAGSDVRRATLAVAWAQLRRGHGELSSVTPEGSKPVSPLLLESILLEACTKRDSASRLPSVIEMLRSRGAARLEAEAWAMLGELHWQRGEQSDARKAALRSVELWDDMATSLPAALRTGFWSDAWRAHVRRIAGGSPGVPRKSGSVVRERDEDASLPQLAPLLANLRELASERDLDTLLVRITDGAVALTGAERGLVLLTEAEGRLEAATTRSAEHRLGKPTVAFSRSIAETVLIDREPVVTVDAADDARVRDYLSVHKLMLKSVACVPIRSRGRTWGVLYLEHRSMKGRFAGTDLSLLQAYADQAAIAIETSKLFEQVDRHKRELEAANHALQRANQRLEQRLQGREEVLRQTRREVEQLRASSSTGKRWGLVGASRGMRQLYDVLERVAASDVSVVITGESGTGKELVARAIHRASVRGEGPFVSVQCGAIPETLLESQLFGHVEGAFTGAGKAKDGLFVQAEGGTLFLDELEDMPARMQLDLLRLLQERRVRPVGADHEIEIDARLIAAAKRPLSELTADGSIREDLYYRLSVVELALPPLRDRREDIPLLSEHFLGRIAEERSEPRKVLSREAIQRLAAHDFPGNVRELEHVLVGASVFAKGDTIEADDLTLSHERRRAEAPPAESYRDFKDAERERILATLNAHDWNRAKAARALGIPRRTFYRRLKEHRIELPKR